MIKWRGEGGTNIREMEMGSIAEEVRNTLCFIASARISAHQVPLAHEYPIAPWRKRKLGLQQYLIQKHCFVDQRY